MDHIYLEDCFYNILVCYINIYLFILGGGIKYIEQWIVVKNKTTLKATALVVNFSCF